MAVAAYASLVSFMHVLDNVHYRVERRRLHADIKQIEALQGRVNFLLEFLELHSERKGERMEGLWRQISEAAFEAEEVFDFHVVSQLQFGAQGNGSDLGFSEFTEDIEGLIQKIDVIKNELLAVEGVLKDFRICKQPRMSKPNGGLSSATSPGDKNPIVGFDEHVIRIMDVLARDESNLKILSIVGMGGSGKTTLAKKVFDDPYIVHHFDLRIWFTISQEYSVLEILFGLLNNGVVKPDGRNINGLGEALHKKLFGRKYLIVMDDVWTEQAWNDLSIFFPNNMNQSRVMMTTRLSHVANLLGSHNLYSMSCLDKNQSWDLFCRTIFAQKDCPNPELKEIGKKIVKSCKGLPLEIIVIGGLLAKSNMRKEHWKLIEENVTSFANSSDGDHCLKILRLSYDHLPIDLKPCFLYMRVFCEDEVIDVSKLIKMWVDEGYIKTKGDKSLEEIGEEYVKDLVDRNLIFFHKQENVREGRQNCGVHDLLRDLCLSESNKEQFKHSLRVQSMNASLVTESVCSLCSQQVTDKDRTFPTLSSTIQGNILPACGTCQMIHSDVGVLRLVNVMEITYPFGAPVQHTKLRNLSLDNTFNLKFVSPPMIQFCWNLQSIYIWCRGQIMVLPSEIWEMPQLRCIEIKRVDLPNPPIACGEKDDFCILNNLHTLSDVVDFECTDDVLIRIPNLKRLRIFCRRAGKMSDASLCNLARLQKLESLYVAYARVKIAFPSSLKRLMLQGCRFPWSDMSIIGSLSNLEFLLLDSATIGSKWNPIEGEFLRLKKLSILLCNLVEWTAEQSHFPNLEHIILYGLWSLKEIPLGIGDIPTLHTIELKSCGRSIINSAYQIWEDQQGMGNETLQILVNSRSISDAMSRRRQ